MAHRSLPPFLVLASWLVACGGDDGPATGDGSSGNATTNADTTTDDPPPFPDTSGDGSTSGDPPATEEGTTQPPTDDTTSDSTGPGGDCQVWEITYDLEGSEFEISNTPFGAGDQVNTVTMPYDADDTVGPGTFVLRFQDVDGSPGGLVAMVSYQMSMHFLVDSGVTTVATDLENDAGPDECGLTTGTLMGDTVAFMPPAIVGHHSMGEILCNGALCGAGGLPNGMPVPRNETDDQPIDDFVFSGDLSGFTVAETVVQMDANSTSSWLYIGTETSRELVDGPACLCP